MSDKTPTGRLRELLDEAGIEYKCGTGPANVGTVTIWHGPYGERCFSLSEERGGRLRIQRNLTPEQAAEATLGRGTCHIDVRDNLNETDGMGDVWLECDACHWQMPLEPSTPRFSYCPNCGRVVAGAMWGGQRHFHQAGEWATPTERDRHPRDREGGR